MRKLLLVLFFFNFIYSQKNNLVQSTPCEHPLILLAEEKGIKAIPIRDLMKFKKIVEDCERLGDKEKMKPEFYLGACIVLGVVLINGIIKNKSLIKQKILQKVKK